MDATGAYLVSDITPLDVGGWSVITESNFMKKESNMDAFFLFLLLSVGLSLFPRIGMQARIVTFLHHSFQFFGNRII